MARQISVEIIGDSRKLEQAFDRSGRSAKKFEASITGMSRSLKGGLAALGVGVGVGTAVAGMKTLVNAASNLNEEMSKNQVVFGRNAAAIQKWSATTANSLGISQRQALATASGFGALFVPLGLAGDQAAEQSKRLTTLGADLASFYNTDVQSALDAIRSGLIGEAEPMRRYGALLSETRVAAEAMAESGKTSAASLTDQEKVLARVNLIFRDTQKAQGDASRTGDQFAGQMRRLTAQLEDMEAALGQALLPHVTELVQKFNEWLANPENKKQVIEGFATAVNDLGAAFKFAAETAGAVKGVFDWFSGHKGPSGLDILGKVGITGATTDFAGRFGIGGSTGARPGSTDVPFPPGWFNVPNRVGGTTGGGTAGSRGGIPGQVGPVVTNALATILDTANKWLAEGKKYDDEQKTIEAAKKAREKRQAMLERLREAVSGNLSAVDIGAGLGVDGGLSVGQVNAAMAARQQAGFQRRLGWAQFALERAEATKGNADNLKAARGIEKILKDQIAVEGRTLELTRQLWETRQKIKDLNKKKGEAITPGLGAVGGLKLAQMLAAGVGGVGRLQQNIAGMKLTAVTVDNRIVMDGREVARSVNTANARTDRRTAQQTSGFRG